MDDATVRAGIAGCPLFAGVDAARLDQLTRLAHGHTVGPRSMVFRQGDACPGIVIVVAGTVRVFKLAPNGKEHVLRLIPPPEAFAEVAVLGDFDCPACAETTETTSYIVVPAAPFRRMLDEDHGFCRQLLGGVARWVHRMVDLLEDVVLRDATSRIGKHLLAHSDRGDGRVALEGSHKDVALHLNLTPETLSRGLRRLTDAGLLEQLDHGSRVVDRVGLEQVADGMYPRL